MNDTAKLIYKIEEEYENKFGEVLMHNDEEAEKMAWFIVDVYKALVNAK